MFMAKVVEYFNIVVMYSDEISSPRRFVQSKSAMNQSANPVIMVIIGD